MLRWSASLPDVCAHLPESLLGTRLAASELQCYEFSLAPRGFQASSRAHTGFLLQLSFRRAVVSSRDAAVTPGPWARLLLGLWA